MSFLPVHTAMIETASAHKVRLLKREKQEDKLKSNADMDRTKAKRRLNYLLSC